MELSDQFYKTLLDSLYDGIYFVDLDRTITYWNGGAERISGYRRAEVVGTRCCDNILVHVDQSGKNLCESDCPLIKAMNQGASLETRVYLHHKEGHRVPVLVRITPICDVNGKIIGGIEVFSDNSGNNASMEIIEGLKKQVFADPLTGMPNRRFMETVIQGRLNELSRYDWRFALIFIDIDHFKSINDNFGHHIGDETLKMVGKSLLYCTRSFDTVSRWGGEEFVAVVVNADQERLYGIAEKYRVIVEKSQLNIGDSCVKVTISVGAALARKDDTAESLIKRADSLMYGSKASGRNRVSFD